MQQLDCDVIVIGAGVIGLACARALALQGRDVIILEAESMIASHTSSRNSEVIHAGIYYPVGSQKAKFCVAGRRALYSYLDDHGVSTNRCGKLVLAFTDEEANGLVEIRKRAELNDVEGLAMLSGAEARSIEPALSSAVVAALHSTVSGIFDSHAYFLALQGELEDAGGMIAFDTPIIGGRVLSHGVELSTGGSEPSKIRARTVINAAGHNAIAIAKEIEGSHQSRLPNPRFVKGSYFTISGKTPFSRLIYPMPSTSSLGIHLTVDLAGRGKLGPDAEWLKSGLMPPFNYQVDPKRLDHFFESAVKFWPGLQKDQLAPDYAGVRPKVVQPGEPSGDFIIDSNADSDLINLIGIESPGLTSSLAIAEHVSKLVTDESPK